MKPDTLIIGAGLVGPVLGTLLAQQGQQVEILERNSDLRLKPARPGKSINITLAERGMYVLRRIGLEAQVKQLSVPVFGRIIHGANGQCDYQPYGNHQECLYSISRHTLASCVTSYAEAHGVKIQFEHKCMGLNLSQRSLAFEANGEFYSRSAPLVVAADGAHSEVRKQWMQQSRMNYSQIYADHANKELLMSAESVKQAGLRLDALHIWPRGEFMLIAFPNLDGSLTCTLHLPFEGVQSHTALRTREDVERLFRHHMPEVLELMPDVAAQYAAHPLIPMVTVKTNPWVTHDFLALIGDAAHAIWPSYGQGANCGFEDSLTLSDCFQETGNVGEALQRYAALRKPNADAIADLSVQHFEEIRSQVGNPQFLERKALERQLNRLSPDQFVPLYNRISFTRMSYVEAIEREQQQRRLVDSILQREVEPLAVSA